MAANSSIFNSDMINRNVTRFLTKLISFILLIILLDQVIGKILEKTYFSVPRKLTYALNESKEDILIFGSSRANRHYNPAILEEKLGLTCFNNGLDGRNIFYNYALLATAVERYTPKIVILDLLDADYSQTESNWNTDRLNVLLPFYGHNKYVDEVINLRSDYEKVKLLSALYPYNSAIVDIVKTRLLKKDLSFGYQGYLPAQSVGGMKNEMDFVKFGESGLADPLKISYLQKLIRICDEKGITLIIILSPWYCQATQNAALLEEIANKNHIRFWNYTFHKEYLDKSLFYDESHLNELGSSKFTEMIATRIQNEIFQDESVK